MSITSKTIYTCTDGKEFDSLGAARAHENDLLNRVDVAYEKWTRTCYGGKKLLEKHSLNETGMWQIKGEDPNCDFGGSHHNPDLGVVEGKLEDVIRYAVSLNGFWTWGGGGYITKVFVKKL